MKFSELAEYFEKLEGIQKDLSWWIFWSKRMNHEEIVRMLAARQSNISID